MQYAVKAGQASTAEESFWQSSMTAAQSAFCQRHGYLSQTSLSGPRLFGIQCQASQQPDCTPGRVWTCVDMCGHVWTLHPAGRSDFRLTSCAKL